MSITAVVLTKNEEKNIAQCLKNLGFCDEVIVVDDESVDKTREIAQESGAKVYTRGLNEDFSAQRNFGLEKASQKRVLFVDADERVSEALASEIKKQIAKSENEGVVGFTFKRHDLMWGRSLKHAETANVRLIRLARRGAGKWKRRVHEFWDIKGRVGELKNPLLHYPHPTLAEFIRDINFMSTLHAREKFEQGERSSLFKILFFPVGKFAKNWVFHLGFLDGVAGFLLALVMSFHSFLGWSKLWLLQRRYFLG